MKKLLVIGSTVAAPFLSMAADPTDITGVISTLEGYRTPAMTLGILLLLFVMGRGIVRKLAK